MGTETTHLDELRRESADVAKLIEENEEAVRACADDCTACRFEHNCSN